MTDLGVLAARMRADSEFWFPTAHGDHDSMLVHYTLGLSGEAGEVANEVKKIVDYDDGVDRSSALGAELADVFTYLLLLADECGVDLEAEYRAKRQKNVDRWGDPSSAGESV